LSISFNNIYHHFGVTFKYNIGPPSRYSYSHCLQNSHCFAFINSENMSTNISISNNESIIKVTNNPTPSCKVRILWKLASMLHFHQPSRGRCHYSNSVTCGLGWGMKEPATTCHTCVLTTVVELMLCWSLLTTRHSPSMWPALYAILRRVFNSITHPIVSVMPNTQRNHYNATCNIMWFDPCQKG
jgi:hypothetical protein